MPIETSPRVHPWATAREARESLGVSERTLARWRHAGLLKPGQHWRRKFPSGNSPVLYHLQACESTMSEAAARTAELLEPSLMQPQRKGHVPFGHHQRRHR